MAEILLNQGKVVIVDEADFQLLSQWNWWVDLRGYAYRTGRKSDGVLWRKNIRMHRQILGLTDPLVFCDHVNHNPLDNRRVNLRACTNSMNVANSRTSADSSTGYKGVRFDKRLKFKPWTARIVFNGREISLGYHPTKEQAALAYNKAAKRLFGEFANLNEVKENDCLPSQR